MPYCSSEDSADLHFPMLFSMKNFCDVISHEMQIFPFIGSISNIERQSDTHIFKSEDSLVGQASFGRIHFLPD